MHQNDFKKEGKRKERKYFNCSGAEKCHGAGDRT